MSKKLEALGCFDKIYNTINLNWQRDLLRVGIDIYNHSDCNDGKEMNNCLDTIKQALLELKAIKESNPNEALRIIDKIIEHLKIGWTEGKFLDLDVNFNTIKNYILKSQEQEKENEVLKEIIKSFFDRGCPLHQYTDKDFGLTIEVDSECSIMHLGKYKGIDLDEKLKEVLE